MEGCPLWTREEEKHKHLLLYSYHLLHGGWILNGKNRTKNTESDHSLNMYLKYLEPVPCFSPFSIPLGCMVGWLQWLMDTIYFFFFTNMAGNILHPEKCFLQDSTVPSILEVTMVTCLLPRTTGRTLEGACCECGHVHSSGGQEVLHPGIVVTSLRSGTNTPALTSSSGVRTSTSVLLTLISTHQGKCGGGGRRKWRRKWSIWEARAGKKRLWGRCRRKTRRSEINA